MKILVTGANGYLGSGIIKDILNRGNEVIAADFKTDRVDMRAKRINCNLFQIEDPFKYFGKPDVVLHLAWRDGFVHYSNAHIDDLPKHYEFLKRLAESGVKRIAVMGSMHEIGFFEGSIDENTPCHPVTPYGIAKNALHSLCEMLCKKNNIKLQWLRGYYIVGNTQYGSSVFSKLYAAALDGKKKFPFTMGQNQYDFLNYSDFCNDVAAVVCQNSVLGTIEIASGHPEKLADRMEEFIVENGFSIKLNYGAFPDRPYDSKAIWGNSKKLDEVLRKDKVKQK